MKHSFLTACLAATLISLSACGGSSSNSTSEQEFACIHNEESVNWNLLLEGNAEKLSDYQLFVDSCNPAATNSERGLPYDLSSALFTDYASKYRFIFIPDDQHVLYNEKEAFDFPTGSVITKTFTMPKDTSKRGIKNETLLETRLLIKRTEGWIARAYVWNKNGTEAFLTRAGENIKINQLKHKGQNLSFTYKVPAQNECLTCHQLKIKNDGTEKLEFKPIGPKARFLNSDYDYEFGTQNQLTKWKELGFLKGLPNNIEEVQKAHPFNDDMRVSDYSGTPEELNATAKSWLDINCAHCHRPGGQASNTGFRVDYNTPLEGNAAYHGICQSPVSGASAGSTKIIVPGDAETSLLYNRLHTTNPGLSMPPLGRQVIHNEGTQLIKAWIDQLEGSCS